MKLIASSYLVLVVLGLSLSGCAATSPPNQTAAVEFLGAAAVDILDAPTRIEGWNFQRPDGTLTSDPGIRTLDLPIAKQLADILLDGQTYRLPSRPGGFERHVGFRVYRGSESIDVFFSFANDQMLVKYLAFNGQPTTSLAGITAARDPLLRVVHNAFPEYKPPAK
jgi:hypothetical protein